MDIFGLPTMNSWIAYIPYGYYFLSKGGQLLTTTIKGIQLPILLVVLTWI